jgi:hypothetical protein
MLDVHPAHHAANSWKEFFVHIATIVLGLLIAVGLEQTVEYFHHLRQVAETREILCKEREDNRQRMAYNTAGFRLQAAGLQNNLLILNYVKRHPGTPPEKLPGVMTWRYNTRSPALSGWMTAQQTGVTALMPREEVARNEVIYGYLAQIDAARDTLMQSFSNATRYRSGDPDITHMTPSQLEDELALLEDEMQANWALGVKLSDLRAAVPDFDTISPQELNALGLATTEDEKASLAAAKALTDARLAQSQAAFNKVRKDFAATHPATAPE